MLEDDAREKAKSQRNPEDKLAVSQENMSERAVNCRWKSLDFIHGQARKALSQTPSQSSLGNYLVLFVYSLYYSRRRYCNRAQYIDYRGMVVNVETCLHSYTRTSAKIFRWRLITNSNWWALRREYNRGRMMDGDGKDVNELEDENGELLSWN